ncbi:carbohydrate kinase family protein [Pseudoruegeria sp. HB172150]|uniref:carbohydrate kinase family protein n=1 Tax=Pseudoruegeria sp. HB172150 TaxID=2721164 RepID=UPI0015530F20
MRVAILGNLNLDLVFQVARLPEPHEKMGAESVTIDGGGAPANVAWWLARLGHEVEYFAVAGDDPLSGVTVDSLARAGVGTGGIRRCPEIGPTLAVILANGSDKRMIGARAGCADRAAEAWKTLVAETDFSSFDRLHTMARAHPLLFTPNRRADLAGIPVSADLNGQYSADVAADFDLCISNHDELARYTGRRDMPAMIAADLAGKPHHVVITSGAEEVAAYRPAGTTRVVPPPVEAVDRSGAGDAFCAGYLHAAWQGLTPEDAIHTGLRLAAAAMSGPGCRPDTDASAAAVAAVRAETS